MFHHQTTSIKATDDRSNRSPSVDLSRLRTTLRLLLDGATADRIVAKSDSASVETTVKRVARAITWEWRSALLRSWRRRQTSDEVDQPLGPQSGVPARGAATLALHVGLGLPVEMIARATSTSAEVLGNNLYQARLNLEPGMTPACGQFVSSIGRYRDGSLDIAARATLIQHAQRCPACRAALDRFQALDMRLLDRIDQERAGLPPLAEQRRTRTFAGLSKPIAMISAIAFLLVIFGASGYAITARRGHDAGSAVAAPGLSGWLLTADVTGNLTALNLADGSQRPLGNAAEQQIQPGFVASSTALSPNKQLIANQIGRDTQYPAQAIVIQTLTGRVLNTIRFADPYARFSGWLGNNTVLEITYPPQEPGESADDYFTRAQTHQSLIGIDIASGDQHELYNGAVTNVFPSPDGGQIAIALSYTQSNSGLQSIELRAITGGQLGDSITSVTSRIVGDPTLTLNGRVASQAIWAPDSSRFYAAIADATAQDATPTTGTPSPAKGIQSLRLVSIARDGTITTLPEPAADLRSLPIDISPDGKRLIIESIDPTTAESRTRLWEENLADGNVRPLTAWSPYWIYSGVWSPDGTTALMRQLRPFVLTTADTSSPGIAEVSSLIALPEDGVGYVALSRMNSELGSNLFAWLPDDAFSKPAEPPMPVRLNQTTAPALSQPSLRIETSAQVSGNDDFVVLYDSVEKRPIIWDRTANDGRQLPPGTHDLSWFPHTSAVIGVTTVKAGEPNGPSRIATYASAFSVSLPSYDYRTYDPAQIGSSLSKQYASPLISPSENALAFFVLDTRDQSVALWLSDYSAPAKPIAHWTLPNDNKLSYVPIAGWIDNQTLLFAEPGDWHNGLPGEVQLNRLTVQGDGSGRIDTATILRRHGTERGIDIDELALNQKSGHIAYRQRHFTKNSTNDGIVDTIAIVSVEKLSDPLEISRGGSSSGLSWSPDGRLLAATTPDDLEFYSATGDATLGVPNLDFPNEPRWIDQNTIWFNESNDQGTRVMAVDLQ